MSTDEFEMFFASTLQKEAIIRPAARGSEPQNECLANAGWNFDWQRTYIYHTPLDRLPTVQAGDVIDVTSARYKVTSFGASPPPPPNNPP